MAKWAGPTVTFAVVRGGILGLPVLAWGLLVFLWESSP